MPNLDDMFVQEFKAMMSQRKAITGSISVNPIRSGNGQVIDYFPLPQNVLQNQNIMKTHLVYIKGIQDEYYSKLNGLTCMLWTKAKLSRKLIDYKGEFILKEDGTVKTEDVPVPMNCSAIIAEIPIGVTTAYEKSHKSECQYVDKIEKEIKGVKRTLFVYIIPKKYCYMVNQSALILTLTKLGENSIKGRFYAGMEVAFTNGYYGFLYVIPYNPIRKAGYKIIATGTHPEELKKIALEVYKFWTENGLVFYEGFCGTPNSEKGVVNVAKRDICGNLDEYEYRNPYAMDKETTLDIDMSNINFEDDTLTKEELAEKYNVSVDEEDTEDYF